MTRHKVIFDTDPGVDDAMALLFLHHHPEIDLLGITTVFGNASIETTTRNALVLKSLWQIAAPVVKGAGHTLNPKRERGEPPAMVHGDNGLGNVALPTDFSTETDPRPAYRFIIDTVRANPGEVTIVAVGRMTNLALALAEAPEITGLVKGIVIMGGAFDAMGNVTPVAEANIHGDPEAADVVMTAPWKVVVVGLDVTSKTVMTRSMLEHLAAEGGERAKFLRDVSQHYMAFYSRFVDNGIMVHDSCACVYVVAPELFTTRSGAIRVACEGVADGQTIQKPDGRHFPPGPWDDKPSQLICTGIDAPAVLALIHKVITRR
jgi:inosine-uridine nucleoside N-ribohydrolase